MTGSSLNTSHFENQASVNAGLSPAELVQIQADLEAGAATMSIDRKHVPFHCPFCGSRNYIDIHEPFTMSTPIGGGPARVIGHQCAGCTVQFGDPLRFQGGLSWLTRLGFRETAFGP